MRAVWITSAAGPDGLAVRETPDPEPGPGQVRIRVRAAGLGFAEVMAAQGLYPDAPKRPCVAGYEVAGVVDAAGDGAADYAAEIRRLTGGEGVDVVLDPLGGADWRKGLKLLRPCGRLVAYGFASLTSGQRRRPLHVLSRAAGTPLLTPLQLMNANKSVSGVNIGHLWGRMDVLREEFRDVLALWEAGTITPLVDSTYPFARAAEAHRRMLDRKNTGKIVLTP